LGADAVDVEHGASTRTLHEVAMKKAMIAASAEAILVVDHSKFQRQAFARFCTMDDLALVITDRDASAELLDPLGERVRMAVA
jgi:DeoR/GlpR family transcriptional regulator of sugar metabolism